MVQASVTQATNTLLDVEARQRTASAPVLAVDTQIATLDQQVATRNAEKALLTIQLTTIKDQAELVTVTPTVRFTPLTNAFRLTFTDLPSGIQLVRNFANSPEQGVGYSGVQTALASGNVTIDIPLTYATNAGPGNNGTQWGLRNSANGTLHGQALWIVQFNNAGAVRAFVPYGPEVTDGRTTTVSTLTNQVRRPLDLLATYPAPFAAQANPLQQRILELNAQLATFATQRTTLLAGRTMLLQAPALVALQAEAVAATQSLATAQASLSQATASARLEFAEVLALDQSFPLAGNFVGFPPTAAELGNASTRLQAVTPTDGDRLRTSLLTQPGVEAVLTPSLQFSPGFANDGQRTLSVTGSSLPDGARLVLARNSSLTGVIDQRSLLPGSDTATFLHQNAGFVGLVDSRGEVLGESFRLSIENNGLTVRQGTALVGQINQALPPAVLSDILTPVTKDSLASVAPGLRLVTQGSSTDFRYEWLPVGSTIVLTNPLTGQIVTSLVVSSRTGNLPLFLTLGQGLSCTIKDPDNQVIVTSYIITRKTDGTVAMRPIDLHYLSPSVTSVDLTAYRGDLRTLATREQQRDTEAARTTLLPRLAAVSVSADTTSRRTWGAAIAEMAGVCVTLAERDLARGHLPNLIGANPTEDLQLFQAEVNRLTALPGSNSRGSNERHVQSLVSDAYARAREDIRTAWPIFCEMVMAGFQAVQSARTDVANPTPASAIDQTRDFYPQSAQIRHLLPSASTILSCVAANFDRCHAFVSGAAAVWQQEVNEASAAGRITRDPNPGLRLPPSAEQVAYDTALTALTEAQRLYRLASASGNASLLSSSKVRLENAQAALSAAQTRLRNASTEPPTHLTHQTLPNSDVITVMNRSALTHLRDSLPQKISSAQQRLAAVSSFTLQVQVQAELTHWQTLKQAAEGLLALIPSGQSVPTIVGSQTIAWARLIERTTTDPGDAWEIGTLTAGSGYGQEKVKAINTSYGLSTATFAVTEAVMMNAWIDGNRFGDLRLLRADGTEVWAARGNRTGTEGESFSGVLAPGSYRLEVSLEEDPSLTPQALGARLEEVARQTEAMMRGETYVPSLRATLHLTVAARSRTRIEGVISREGSERVLPVRLSVAEFTPNGQRKSDYLTQDPVNRVAELDPSEPVWVVIHGMYNNDGQAYPDADFDDTMHLLTKSMAAFGQLSGTQVVTIDWHEAARDNHILGPLQDATWTERVGAWVGSQLLGLGFPPSKINIAGFSHGTYVSYFAAKTIQEAGAGSVQSIVALDPATNVGFLNGNGTIDASAIRFSEVANTSVALKASITPEVSFSNGLLSVPGQIAALSPYHQIEFGSDARALTAHHSFNLLVGGQTDQSRVHNFPVTAFSRMVQDIVAGHPNGLAQSVLNPFNLLTRVDGAGQVTKSSYDGVVRAVGALDHGHSGVAWAHALPVDILLRDGTLLDLEDHLYDPLP